MADRVVSGIGRELRYFEYKFRKNRQKGKNKDKNENMSQDLAWADSSTSQSRDFEATSEEVRKAAPASTGEEQLQIQVALAMSREEEEERDRQSQSDKLRLELAIKESMQQEEVNRQTQQVKNQPSLLDLSLNAPKPSAPAQSNLFEQPMPNKVASNDPWGATAISAPANTFDPFAQTQSTIGQASSGAVPQNNGFSSGDTWGMPLHNTQQQTPPDPWAVSQPEQVTASLDDPWAATATMKQADPIQNRSWGGVTSLTQPAVAQGGAWVGGNSSIAPTTSQVGAWGSPNGAASAAPYSAWNSADQFESLVQSQQPQKTSYDPFSGVTTSNPLSQSSDVFGANPSTPASNPSLSNNPFNAQGSDVFTAPPFDPLKDFDNLHIGSNEPEPVLLTNDIAPGASVTKDLFPVKQAMEPTTAGNVLSGTANADPRSSFLGENSSLVNLDSGWKYQAPFSTKPLGSTAHNPFQQTGPTRSLNEMMGTRTGFQ